jgi:hypothetical protein
MALARKTSQRPGGGIGSRQVVIEDFYVTSSNVDFSIVQPKGTIVESVHVFYDGLTTLSGGGAGAAGDANLTIGTNSDFSGTEVLTSFAIADYTDDPSLEDGKVVDCAANIVAAIKANAVTESRVLYGRIAGGDATATGTNRLQIHIGFRHF